jgi:riboflavin-specific deaminase-like protein
VALNMVTSLDGAIAVEGRSGGLGSPADRAIFLALRSCADVILVGAGTVRAEDYGPPRPTEAEQQRRIDEGRSPLPRLAVVTGGLDLDPAARLFSDPDRRPLIITTTDAPADRRQALAPVADLLDAGTGRVDVAEALAMLGASGAAVVLCEGGPTLNGQLVAAGVVDEVCLTIAPLVVGGPSPRMVVSAHAATESMDLDRALEEDGNLFLRYVRSAAR